jgi:predicted dithiol-disulfide oxidoreductase (DUF899 family)
MGVTFPNESAEYRAARDAVLAKEVELRRLTEEVAAGRRGLPPGGEVSGDYLFERIGSDGEPETVPMSALFSPGKITLAVYHFMFGPDRESPCPGCTSLLDQLDGATLPINESIDFVISARSSIQRLAALAEVKGYHNLRFVSTGDAFSKDYHGTLQEGMDLPFMNVFRKDGDAVRHFWGAEIMHEPAEPDQDGRQTDVINPYWNVMDLTPEGRFPATEPDIITPKIPVNPA